MQSHKKRKISLSNQGEAMSTIGVDARTYALAHSRTYSACLNRCRDTTEAKRLAAHYMRDWYVVEEAAERA
jgi:hypothetical protein